MSPIVCSVCDRLTAGDQIGSRSLNHLHGVCLDCETWSNKETAVRANVAWRAAVVALMRIGFTPFEARRILDSKLGRHMADQMSGSRVDIGRTIARLATTSWLRDMASASLEAP